MFELKPMVDFIHSLHPFIAAVVYFFLLLLLSYIFDKSITAILNRQAKSSKESNYKIIINTIHRPIYYTIFLFGIIIFNHWILIENTIMRRIDSFCITLLLLTWSQTFIILCKCIINIQEKKNKRKKRSIINTRTKTLFINTLSIITYVLAIYFIFLAWGIEPTGWAASAGVLSIVLGFAARDTLGNVFSGIFIMADSPYVKGDYINLDSGERGYIHHIGLRTTRILTRDNIEIILPNSVIANSTIINESGGPREHERIRINVGVGYDSDVDKIEEILVDIAKKNELVCQTPEPVARFRTIGSSSLDFQLLCWIQKPEKRGLTIHQLNKEIFKTFTKEKIEMPFQQITIHKKEH